MKNFKNIFLTVIFFSFLGCKKEETKQLVRPTDLKKTESKKQTDLENVNFVFSEKDFTMIYKYSDGDSNQILGINIVDKNKIVFHLVSETLPCDTEYKGIAVNKYSDIASEVDEDENGTTYGAIEYSRDEKEYSIAIRMALDSSKVQIQYADPKNRETDCFPITKTIMKRIK